MINKIINEAEAKLKTIFEDIDKQEYKNSLKVLSAFHKAKISESSFVSSSGYGYNDRGREQIEEVFANILGGEDALVRNQIISGTHAISTALFGILRPNERLLYITGSPYDTLHEVIGIKNNNSSLISFGILYDEIDLLNDDFDYGKIKNYLENNEVKVVAIQMSRGYSLRKSIPIILLEKVVTMIKKINKEVIIFVDNCYCEFVEDVSPLEVGCDLIAGSLIKNLGGGICSNGGYIVGKKSLVHLAAERLNVAGEAKEVGASNGFNKLFLQGIYHAPFAVASSLKTAILTSYVLEKLGYSVSPKYNEKRSDIIQSIIFEKKQDLIKYIEGIQMGGAIDSFVFPFPSDMPGYKEQVIMASPSFTSGSSIEISCDGPLREPYIAFQQGALTYSYGKLALKKALEQLKK
ncbi:MAG: hypothetical protein GX951_01255 [Mollicutes bacterium]|nr:hypothetical protein [Mollicutes bacterium]